MKYFILLLLLAGCTTANYRIVSNDCITKDEFFGSVTTLLVSNGFKIVHSDLKLGYLQAETGFVSNPGILGQQNSVWSLTYNQNGLTAQAWAESESMMSGRTTKHKTPYGDFAHKSHSWYWNVRNGLDNLCKNVRVEEIK
jgi:hypothetical protein